MGNTLREFDVAYGLTLQEWVDSGGSAGEYIQNYNKWLEDPIAFYQTQPIPYFAVYNEIAERESSPEAMPDVNQEIERIRRQESDKDETKDGYFKLGTVELDIPPIQITVSDLKHNSRYKTLRTKSDIAFQSGKSTKIIELDVYFHDIDDINNKLRPLLAQLKCMPLIPIYSDYLSGILMPKTIEEESNTEDRKLVESLGGEKEAHKETREIAAKIDQKQTALREALFKNKSLMSSKPTLLSDLTDYWNQTLSPYNSSKLDQKLTLTENIKNILTESRVAENIADKDSIISIALNTEIDIRALRERKNRLFNGMGFYMEDRNLVGVLSQISVGTVSGFPESLACHMTMFLFNYHPFSTKFEYVDKNNNPTLDVDKCLYFIQWYTTRFLQGGNQDIEKYFATLEGPMNGEVKFSYSIDPEEIGANPVSTDNDSVCVSVMVVQRNSISFLPVLQWSVPTCQYMGSNSAEILLTFDTIDDRFINNLRNLFEKLELQSRSSVKSRRKNYVTIDNELLKLMGISRCILQKIDLATVEGSPGMTRITLNLLEFDIRQTDPERIVKIIKYNDEMGREFLRADIKSYLENPNNVTDLATFPKKRQESFREAISSYQTYLDAVGYYAPNVESIQTPQGPVVIQPGEIPGYVPFTDERQVNKLISVMESKELGYIVQKKNKNVLYVKKDKREDFVPYSNSVEKPLVAKYLMNKVLGKNVDQVLTGNESIDRKTLAYDVSNSLTDAELDILLYNTPQLENYKDNYVRETIDSYLGGNSTSLPQGVLEAFEKKGLTGGDNRPVYTYPDMSLPTYNDTKKVGMGAVKPTYESLGVRSALGNQSETPRVDSDLVEPDFCFYYGSIINMTYQWGDSSLVFQTRYNDGIAIFNEDFQTITQTEIPAYIVAAKERKFSNYMSKMDIDDLLDKDAAAEKDAKIDEEQTGARNRRDETQIEALTPSTAEENSLYNKYIEETRGSNKLYTLDYDELEGTINKFTFNTINYPKPGKFAIDKSLTEPPVGRQRDSGKNVYGGILPDSSFYEEGIRRP